MVALFLLSKLLTNSLYKLFYRITKSKKKTVYLFALTFAPGTLIHELSHFLMALVLLVPVRDFEIIPKIEKDRVKLGSTPIGKTDFVRRAIVGFAPLLFGIGAIFGIIQWGIYKDLLLNPYYLLLAVYFIFQIGNTMYTSKKDLEGAWVFGLLVVFIISTLFVFDVNFPISATIFLSEGFTSVITNTSMLLLIPITLDILVVSLLSNKKIAG